MKLLITPSNERYTFIVLDTETGAETRVDAHHEEGDSGADNSRARHRPFGITWDGRHVYVANRRHICVYDHSLKFKGKIENVLCGNPHGITMVRGGYIGACLTSCDTIGWIDPMDGGHLYWHVDSPHPCLAPPPLPDTRHINSIVTPIGDRDLVFVNSSNRGERESSVLCHQTSAGGLQRINEIVMSGTIQSHGLLIDENCQPAVLDTGRNREIASCRGYSRVDLDVPEDHFLRGMAADGYHIAVAHFERSVRRYRGEGDSIIKLVDRETNKVASEHVVKDIGAVNEMRLLGEHDWCHHNKVDLCV